MKGEVRVYPACCQSAFCGRLYCDGCRNADVLRDFLEWKADTGAIKTDPVWCPTVWTAQRDRA